MENVGCAGSLCYVRAVIYKQSKMLLLKENKNGVEWNFPGGKIESGESPESAVGREVKEEIGVECRSVKQIACGKFIFNGIPWIGWYFYCKVNSFDFVFEPTVERADFFADVYSLNHGIPSEILEICCSQKFEDSF